MAYEGYKGYGTPENVARKRRIAEALAASVFRGGRSPQTIGDALNQGLGQVGAALASRGIGRKADKAEREAREASGTRSREAIVAALTGRAASAPSSADSIDPDGRGTAPQQWSPAMAERAISEPPVDTAALEGVDPRTVDAFGNLQASYGQPLNVTSGVRSPEHNARVGGADKSRHMAEHGGDAVDIDTSGMSEAEKRELLQEASAQGFTGIGVYDNSIHLDRGPPRAWGPSYGRESVPEWAQPVVEAHLASGGAQPTATMAGNRVAQSGQTMTDAAPQIDAEVIQTLQGVLNDPWASPADKQIAVMVLEQEIARMQGPEPMSQYERARLGLDQKEFGFEREKFGAEHGLDRERLELEREKARSTGDLTEYDRYVEQQKARGQEPLGFLEYQSALKSAGKPETTINMEGDSAWSKESAKLFAKRYDDLTTQADSAGQMLGLLDMAEQGLNTGIRTGAMGESEHAIRQLGAAMGIGDAEKVAGGELLKAVTNRMALMMRSPDSGMGMPGAVSDRDLQFLSEAQIGIDRSPEGNRRMLEAFRKLERRKIEIARLADQYIQQHGRLDVGFNEAVKEYAKANPLFPPPQVAEPAGGERNVPPEAVEVLRADPSPEARAEFNEVFGPGAAARVLGQ